jgi:two-component system phosphate regulon sensor histidine kinase PhoR
MNMNKAPFPWHHYIKTVRIAVLFIILTAATTFAIFHFKDENVFSALIIVIITLTILAFIIGYINITPFRHLLQKIEDIQVQLPHDKKLDLIYRKDEWVLLGEMLKLTQSYMDDQKQNIESQLKKSSTIIEYIPDGIVIVDRFLNIKEYNTSFKNKFIQSDISGMNEEKLWKVFDENSELAQKFSHAAKKGESFQVRSYYVKDLNEYFNISILPIQDSKNKITAALGIFHNTTQEKLNEKMRVDFVANVSHEIRTPLTSIKGYTQLLEAHESKLPEELRPILKKITGNTERLKDLFENLLRLSKIESQYQISNSQFDLQEMLSKIQGQLKGKFLTKNFKIDFLGEQNIYGDPKLIEQVFVNLIDNAIKYSDKELTTIHIVHTISLHHHIISIKDNGIGLNQEDISRIFERFYRVQGKSEKVIEGTGLGLSIVKHIINRHHGEIEVKSEEGKGSEFIIQVPIEDQ